MAGSLYIHIPFCRRKCLYCDFSSAVYDGPAAGAYIGAIAGEIRALEGAFDSIYIGGGTPTVLEKAHFVLLLESLRGKAAEGCEYTVEANPESLNTEKLSILADFGVNRLSVGVQSLDDRKLKKLGRIHSAASSSAAVEAAHKRGFVNIGADAIFGIWGETLEDWRKELERLTALPVSHVSCYCLTYEKGTPLYAAVKNGSVSPLDDEAVARMYEAAIDALALRGFKQYEVSNFAREGYRCRHNLRYWDNDQYVGIGASAVSYIAGVRTKNVSDIKEYVRRVSAGRSCAESSEALSPLERAKETAAVKIRTREGIDFAQFKARTGYDFMELEGRSVARLVDDGLIRFRRQGDAPPTGIELKRKGFLFCDTVSSALL